MAKYVIKKEWGHNDWHYYAYRKWFPFGFPLACGNTCERCIDFLKESLVKHKPEIVKELEI